MLRGSHFGKPPNKRSRRSGGLLSGKKKGVKLSVLALIRELIEDIFDRQVKDSQGKYAVFPQQLG